MSEFGEGIQDFYNNRGKRYNSLEANCQQFVFDCLRKLLSSSTANGVGTIDDEYKDDFKQKIENKLQSTIKEIKN